MSDASGTADEYEDALDFIDNLSLEDSDPLAALFLSLLISPPILDNIFSSLETTEIIRISFICRITYSAVKYYIRRAFSFEKHFRPFFNDTHDFRRLLAQTGSIVSGSNVLQLLTRTFWPESDLDLYVYSSEAKNVCQWLTSNQEGYTFSPSETQPQRWTQALEAPGHDQFDRYRGTASDIRRILDFTKLGSVDGTIPERRVQVMVCGTSKEPVSLAYVVLRFHSTCVMNIITHHATYCLYPTLTIRDKELLRFNLGNWDMSRKQAVARYESRGWNVIDLRSFRPNPKKDEPYFQNIRYIGDAHCWTIKHTTSDDIPDYDVLVMNSWKVTFKPRGSKLYIDKCQAPGLKYAYTLTRGRQGVAGIHSLVDIIEKIKSQESVEDVEEYRGDELDRRLLDTWQKLKDPEFARS